jgi:hypothetical protein
MTFKPFVFENDNDLICCSIEEIENVDDSFDHDTFNKYGDLLP